MKRTDIVVLLDRSGSMQAQKSDHEGGLRSFVDDQKSLAGDVRFTLIQFDSENPCEVMYDATPIADVRDITLIPRGGTPLMDAMLKAMAHVEKTAPSESNVMFMVITDGCENGSREASKASVQSRTKELESKGWVFLYLGANVDAFAESQGVGIARVCATNFANNAAGINAAYASANKRAWLNRTSSASGQAMGLVQNSYTGEERSSLAKGAYDMAEVDAAKAQYLATSQSGEGAKWKCS